MSDTKIPVDLNRHSSFFFISMTMMLSRNNNAIIPEVLYFMEPEQVVRLCQVFGGSRPYVPTPQELGTDLKCSLAAYYHLSRGYSWEYIKERMDIDGRTLNMFKSRVADWNKYMTDLGVDTSNPGLYSREDEQAI